MSTSPRSLSSSTTTVVATAESESAPQNASGTGTTLVLNLRERPSLTWSEDTIDNEHLGKKSSKRCCIFHKVKKFDESDSDESDSDTEKAREDEKKQADDPKKVPAYQRHHA